jgi:putative ABC transport system permease protein
MRTVDFIVKESRRRGRKSFAGVLLVLLGISIFVASETLHKALEERTKEQLLRFGANIVVQPKGSPFDPFSGTVSGDLLLPESHAGKIRGIEHGNMLVSVSPKLYERFDVNGKSILVVGITPDEAKAKPWWMIDGEVFADELPEGQEILLGHHVAGYFDEGAPALQLGGEEFSVRGVLDETGSPDDFMAFVDLATLQSLAGKGGMVSIIEVSTSCIACKSMNIHDVAADIGGALPGDSDVKIIRQIAEAQMGTLGRITGLTTTLSLVVLGLCAFLLMNHTSSMIEERRREVGMLLAMGMDPRKVQAIFISKVLGFAVVGGLLGYLAGTGISMILGPAVASVEVFAIPRMLPFSLLLAVGLGFVSSLTPLHRLSRLDPVEALREV